MNIRNIKELFILALHKLQKDTHSARFKAHRDDHDAHRDLWWTLKSSQTTIFVKSLTKDKSSVSIKFDEGL